MYWFWAKRLPPIKTRNKRNKTLFFIDLLFLHQINDQIMALLFIGTQELLIIGLIVLLLFGGTQIPKLMRGLGKGVKSFKDGMNGKDEEKSDEVKSEK